MSCKTISAEMFPLKRHEIEIYESEGHAVEIKTKPHFSLVDSIDKAFKFNYCVSYRHPSLPEWILARGWWNDEGIWTPDGLWYDQ